MFWHGSMLKERIQMKRSPKLSLGNGGTAVVSNYDYLGYRGSQCYLEKL